MNSDNAGAGGGDPTFGGIFASPAAPRATVRRVLPRLPDAVTLANLDPDDLVLLLEALLSARRREDPAETVSGERHQDGSLRLPSLEAVWLVTQIGKAVGVHRLLNLRNVPVSKLRSLHGIAELAIDAVWTLGYVA